MTKTRAILIESHGPPGALVERERVLPDPRPGEVHVRVDAAGVNFADLLMRAGLYGTAPPRPYSPGFEVSGVVVRSGGGCGEIHEGDRVVALLRHGGYARDLIVPAGAIAACPSALPAEEAAAIPVNFLTASICLLVVGRAAPGETALILGAGGGVGTAAVQMAVRRGLRVLGTAGSERKRRLVVDVLGAQGCFDSRGRWEEDVRAVAGARGVDIALDPVGGPATDSCRSLLAPLGRLVFYGLSAAMPGRRRRWLPAALAWARTPRFHPLSLVEPNLTVAGVHLLHLGAREPMLVEKLRGLLDDAAAGRLRPVIDQVFPLDAAGATAAHERLHARLNLGKVVLSRGAEPD